MYTDPPPVAPIPISDDLAGSASSSRSSAKITQPSVASMFKAVSRDVHTEAVRASGTEFVPGPEKKKLLLDGPEKWRRNALWKRLRLIWWRRKT